MDKLNPYDPTGRDARLARIVDYIFNQFLISLVSLPMLLLHMRVIHRVAEAAASGALPRNALYEDRVHWWWLRVCRSPRLLWLPCCLSLSPRGGYCRLAVSAYCSSGVKL